MEADAEGLEIEVAYARRDVQPVVRLTVPPDATVRDAIEVSGLLSEFPEIDLERNRVGVYGRICGLNDLVQANDRVEIYRPLVADPKAVRRRRARD